MPGSPTTSLCGSLVAHQYVVGVEDGGMKAPRIDHAYGEHPYAAVDEVFGTGHLPDSVCAMALAWMGAAPKAVMTGRLSA